jgi:hypothetical protein
VVGQQSLKRSALVEAIAQFTRALDQIAALSATPALRREQIKIQVALINQGPSPRTSCAPSQARHWPTATRSISDSGWFFPAGANRPIVAFGVGERRAQGWLPRQRCLT